MLMDNESMRKYFSKKLNNDRLYKSDILKLGKCINLTIQTYYQCLVLNISPVNLFFPTHYIDYDKILRILRGHGSDKLASLCFDLLYHFSTTTTQSKTQYERYCKWCYNIMDSTKEQPE